MTDQATSLGLTPAQVEAFAAGLLHLARVNGVTPRERELIDDFLLEAGCPDLIGRLDSLPFDPVETYRALETSWLRDVFLEAALLIIRADHQVTPEEREALTWLAGAFGVHGGYAGVAARVEGEAI